MNQHSVPISPFQKKRLNFLCDRLFVTSPGWRGTNIHFLFSQRALCPATKEKRATTTVRALFVWRQKGRDQASVCSSVADAASAQIRTPLKRENKASSDLIAFASQIMTLG
jgi:hypothetical protein